MREIISIRPENRPPDLIEYEKLEFRDRADIYGIDREEKTRRLADDAILAAYGHDPNIRQEPVQAIWHTQDQARRVTVTGFMSLRGGEEYLTAVDADTQMPILTGVPKSQLDWRAFHEPAEDAVEQQPTQDTEPEVVQEPVTQEKDRFENNLDYRITELQATVMTLKQKVEELDATNTELTQKNSELERQNSELTATVDQLRGELAVAMGVENPPPDQPNRWSNWRVKLQDWRDRAYTLPGRMWLSRVQVYDTEGRLIEERREGTAVPYAVAGAIGGFIVAYLIWKNGNHGIDIDQYQTIIENQDNIVNHPDYGLQAIDNQQESIINNPDWGLKAVDNQQEEILRNQATLLEQNQAIINNPDWGLKAVDDELEAAKDIIAGADSGGMAPEYGELNTQSLNYYGDTIWSHVEKSLQAKLGYQPSDSQVQHATQRVLELNGLSWAEARSLPVGYDFKMPARLLP